ncbi:hypothetical protein GW571_14715 (plasmid) [Clavibacter capsici]|uniref:Uncharacterized protein n=2 Tax=Clavibacter capsici TaxID=1874630 RepID=A0AAE6XTT1_9MICO|nr:hypothetical protein [Clavibacter capsici]QIS40575.1 hypothetical protein GW572_15505 [Clavibacter capsici]QIS43493.1 hypothetical protein GW571_14715 [Clavibacter capsici]QIS46460.1 hypothetical protein GW570_14835 [Clavibacter capsici]
MSALENYLKYFIMGISTNNNVILDAWSAQAFTRWAIKTAMMRGIWENRTATLYPDSHRADIMAGEVLPEGWTVAVGVTENWGLATGHWAKEIGYETEPPSSVRAMLCTLRIFNMMVIVSYTDSEAINRGLRRMLHEYQDDTQLIWPMNDVPIFPGEWSMPDANVALYQELFRTIFEKDATYLLDENINRPDDE